MPDWQTQSPYAAHRNRARQAAMRRLRDKYRDEYWTYYVAEMRAAGYLLDQSTTTPETS